MSSGCFISHPEPAEIPFPRMVPGRSAIRSIEEKKEAEMKMVLAVAVVLVAAVYGSPVAREGGLTVEKMVFCTGIEDRAPAGENTQFFEQAERIYCFTRIGGAADTLEVTHVWYYGDEEKARVPLAVKSASWRTWSSKKMLPAWTGAWRVDVLGPGGEVLMSREFVYKPVGE